MSRPSTDTGTPRRPRVWLITGASSGFGLEITKLALRNGDIAIATYRSSSEPPILASLKSSKLLLLRCDVTSSTDVNQVFSTAEKTFGRIDVVFNNAGITLLGEIEGTPEDKAREMFDVNFWGMSHISREAVRVFRDVNRVKGGRLLNVSSGAGVVPNAGIGYYSASKHALEGFTEALAKEMDPAWNIKITILEPGAFKTRAHTDNTTSFPSHPAYSENPNLASNQVRQWFSDRSGITGDPVLAAKRIYEFVEADEAEIPMRLQLGDDSWYGIKAKLEGVIQEQQKFEKWSKGLALSHK
ncbi:NAD(P)-bindingprotein [Moniliophthora roreri]|uniref:NAD(P)-binding protein n=1 Tax=Moniliophthora roreri TaxID=221103 RepID=A0A0W0GEE7_MONRR|nr:NAD(P)-bindingprotein [Moniliophthora roreri]